MNKAEFIKEAKNIDFNKLKKADKELHDQLFKFTQAIQPEIVGKKDAPEGKKPHEGEFPKEVQKHLAAMFEGIKTDFPQVLKTFKTPLEKKIRAFEIALSVTDDDKDKEILKKKIKTFKLALSVEKMKFEHGGSIKTYDVVFHDDQDSNNKGFNYTIQECKDYIEANNGTNHSYFKDYKGGIVTVTENETGEIVFETEVY